MHLLNIFSFSGTSLNVSHVTYNDIITRNDMILTLMTLSKKFNFKGTSASMYNGRNISIFIAVHLKKW